MKQKCILSKKKNTLVLKEVAQTEPGSFSLIYETELDNEAVEKAVANGTDAIIDLFRSVHFYPVSFFAEKLADGIAKMFGSEPADSLHIEFNDIENLQSTAAKTLELEELEKEKELAEIDKLLEDDSDFEIEGDADPSVSAVKATSVSDEDTPEA